MTSNQARPAASEASIIAAVLEKEVLAKIECCYQRAEVQLQRTFPRPTINFNQRGKIAGSARLQVNELRFNKVLLLENHQHFIFQTVPHEVAHLIVHHLYGRTKPHGREWQYIMIKIFELAAKTTHQYDIGSVKGETFTYACQCREHQLTVYRHNKIVRNKAGYLCRYCKQALVAKN
ncbi:MAG: SprT protein [Moritella sp.]|jgi:SprT protein